MGGRECIRWYTIIDETEHRKHFIRVPTMK
jgi:hypothetical protein